MTEEKKTKEKLLLEIKELRKTIYDLEMFKLTRENVQQALIDNEARLIESERRYRMIFDSANDGIIVHEPEGKILDVNASMYTRLGYTKAEMLEMNMGDLIAPDFSDKIGDRTRRLDEDGVAIFESGDIRRDGTVMPVEVSARIVDYRSQKAILSVVRDITQRKMAEDLILTTLEEKEILVEEIQDQVKRNMLSLSLMLDQVSQTCPDNTCFLSIQNVRARIKSYSNIYGKIYRYKNYTKIDFAEFCKWLTGILFSQNRTGIANIRLGRDIQDIFLHIREVVPCGLIVYELVSNTLDHAFHGGKKGEIKVGMKKSNKNQYRLKIEDTGIGLPENLDFNNANSLGFQLVKDFVAQLEGEIKLESSAGTQITVIF